MQQPVQQPGGVIDYKDQHGQASQQAIYRLWINVKVCASPTMLEPNCVRYGSNYKPEGLVQKYSKGIRYSAFSYYNDSYSSPERDGGVMRARMKFVAPTQTKPGSPPVANSAAEWDAKTGVMVSNPDSADAASTVADAASDGASVSITRSGVINYLNEFGYASRSYKTNDPLGELYYAVTRYFRNKGNVEAYSSLRGVGAADAATYLDGFPAIRKWDDPMLYSCQKNFILGLGDIATNADGNVPGANWRSTREGPTLPVINGDDLSRTGPNDDTPDGLMKSVVDSTSMVWQLEGGDTRVTGWEQNVCNAGGNSNNYMAGMAYDMHVRDIRPDLPGVQTINTYFMDVEQFSEYCHKNVAWLASKYGGFTIPKAGFSPYAVGNNTRTLRGDSWESNDILPDSGSTWLDGTSFSTDVGSTDKRPRNYFPGDAANTMKEGLIEAFAKIASEATVGATSTALASSSPQQEHSGGANYAATYDPSSWTGALNGQTVKYARDGKPTLTDQWRASAILDARGWSSRQIVSYCKGNGVAFRPGMACSASFAAVDGVSAQSATNYINYLRGDRSQEIANQGVYRTRTSLLGDIVDAKVVAVAAPDMPLSSVQNPGYADFKHRYARRGTVVYVGANDGMLHAFDGSITSPDGGKELFAYIPSLIYSDNDPNTAGGLSSFGNPAFIHRFLVDGTPNVFDIDFLRAGQAGKGGSGSDWHSVLIGGLGKGGKGYYAIDVTDPASWTSEQAVAGKVLWEFANGGSNGASTTTHMGYSYGDAVVVKTAKYGWVVVLTSGYNNDDGRGYFFFINPQTGALLETLVTPDGSISAPLNLAKAAAFVPNFEDGTADAIYAGDLQGNIWRVDLSASSGKYPAPTKIAILRDAHGTEQPVTTRPLIEIDPDSAKRYVLIGTGRLLADSDVASAQRQSFYAIIDGTGRAGGFYGGSSQLPSGLKFPVTRSDLEENRDLIAGISSQPTKLMGWYYDMQTAGSIAERVNVDPAINQGIVAWVGNLPNGQACSPGGISRTYVVDVALGRSTLRGNAGKGIASIENIATTTDVSFVSVGGEVELLTGQSSGAVSKVDIPSPNAMKRLNWRTVRTTE